MIPSERIHLIESILMIEDKDRHTVPLKLNKVQCDYLENRTNRNIILKARQLGMSSIILADLFLEAITVPNTICVVVSHEQHATERLLAKIHSYHRNLRLPVKPEPHHMSAAEISFPEMNSTIYIGTARSMTFGRGERIDRAHLSELAFYDDGERIVNAIEEAVPLHGIIEVECSPNGENNHFYMMWLAAKEGKSSYTPFFFPWYMGEDYSLTSNSGFAMPSDRGPLQLDEEEKWLSGMGVTEDQLRWRRRKLADKLGLFYQEYPEDEVNCFLTSGEPVFDSNILARMSRECYEGEPHPSGFTIWIHPEKGNRYVIGADCSAGVEGGSESAACVLDDYFRVCATFHGRVPPEEFAEILAAGGEYYNDAELVVERNAQGYAVLAQLLDYPNIYYQRDYTTGRETAKAGWWTSAQTKVFMMTKFRELLPHLQLWDKELVRQARGYRYVKMEARPQTLDDLLISCMIAIAAKTIVSSSVGYVGAGEGYKW